MKSRKKILTQSSIVAVLILLTLGCKSNHNQQSQMRTPEVGYIELKHERVILETTLPGRTSSFLVAEIKPQVNGIIQKRLFEEGANVKKGEILYQIDPAPYQAVVDQAKAAVAMSEATLPSLKSREARLKKLLGIHAVGQQDYDNALAALQQAEAQLMLNKATLKTAKINLSYTPIKSPITGKTGKSSVTEGAMVTAYQPVSLVVIQQMDPVYVDVTQSAGDILKLKNSLESGSITRDGDHQNTVKLILQDGSIYKHDGTLKFKDISVDSTTGTVTLRIVFPNPDGDLLPGMFVQAVIKEGVTENGILVPQQAVTRNTKGLPFAYIIKSDNTAEYRQLTLDREVNNTWLVSSGLSGGDKVIVDGLQSIRGGMKVNSVPWKNDKHSKVEKSGGGK